MTEIEPPMPLTPLKIGLPISKETLTKGSLAVSHMNENVVSVLEVIGRDYRRALARILTGSLINPVYLGQLIKRKPTRLLRNCSTSSD